MKQVILVRSDLGMSPGKTAAQSSHASVEAVLQSDKKKIDAWKKEGMTKVVLKVKNEAEMLELNDQAKGMGVVAVVITDAGRTEIEPGTRTCVGIGPDEEEKINKITGKLKPL